MRYFPIMDGNSNYRPKAPSRSSQRRTQPREKRGSRTYSSSEDDFYSDDNLRPYEEVKLAHHDKKLNGLDSQSESGSCKKRLSWYLVDDQDQVYGYAKQLLVIPYGEGGLPEEHAALLASRDKTDNVRVHHPVNGPSLSNSSSNSKPRLYSYQSGSDGDVDTDNPMTSTPHQNCHWRRGSNSSLSSDELDSRQMLRNERVSQLSLSESDQDNTTAALQQPTLHYAAGPLPPPTFPPPPPPPPIADIPQRVGPNVPQQVQASRHYAFGPSVRGNYSDKDNVIQRNYSDVEHPAHRGVNLDLDILPQRVNPYSEGDISDFEPHYIVQTASGNVFVPQDALPRFPRTVPRSGSVPTTRTSDLPSPNSMRPVVTEPGKFSNGDQQANLVLNDRNVFLHPAQFTPTVPMGYPATAGGQEYGYYTKFNTAKHRWKKQLQRRCSWKCMALILLVFCVALLAAVAYLAMKFVLEEREAVAEDKECTQEDIHGSPLPSGNGAFNGTFGFSFPKVTRLHGNPGDRITTPPTIPPPFNIGEIQRETIPPKSFWQSRFTQDVPKFAKFNFTIPPSATLGLYGRRGAPPSITQFDFFEVLDGRTINQRTKRTPTLRSSSSLRKTALTKYLKSGVWFLAVYNDGDDPQTVAFKTSLFDTIQTGCPGDCHGQGDCVSGQCQCYPGYTGWDCLQSTCAVLCNGNGIYVRGVCQCHQGWKGRECEVRENECEVSTCNGNGRCIDGKCICHPGFQGPDCGIVDCLLPNCSGNGVCVLGKCLCYKGFKGTDCSIPNKINVTHVCAKDCSGHGLYNVEEGRCECERLFTGDDCETEICRLECFHGFCKNQKCNCNEGWGGALCDQLKCDYRCDGVRGFCNNGTCECRKGWNGKHCSLDGCPNDCSNNGVCQSLATGWACNCRDGWKGNACDIAMETQCKDHTDNDGDGLSDCLDPDCCVSMECKDNMYCRASPDPVEILLRKQPPSTTASFYEKMRFLVEENSVQMETSRNALNESQVSVIRGRVKAKDGTPLVGVKVDVFRQPLYGYTLTREEGLFDILVNGGGSVTLQFSRQPFLSQESSVLVPWNQIITIATVTMVLTEQEQISPDPQLCGIVHDHYLLQPVVLSTWQHTQLGSCPDKSTIIPESQVLQESIAIPGTNVHLVYHSSETPGYRSVIMIQMTPKEIPVALALVHLRVSVEGIVFEKMFEADPGLKYTYAWDRRNAYRQKVYGIVPVRVNVGYQYSGCGYVFWEARSTTMSGFDLTSSEIGGWNLDLHHTYNFQEGILHKGDGTNIYLKEKPQKLISILGSGQRRRADCDGCNGRAIDNRLLAPVALASGRDGSLYVWDYNFVRKLSPSREEIASILQIGTYTSHKPYMTVSPVDSRLYISDYMNRRVIRVKTMGPVRDLADNYEVVAGTGEECTPGDRELCGDGKAALMARFLHPKGIAIDKEGVIYIADGANVRMITTDGIIHTLIGSQDQPRSWKPMSCDQSQQAEGLRLQWPTALTIDPLDDELHILDDNMVLKMTKDHKVVTVAGHPITCPQKDVNFLPTGVLTDDEQASSIAAHVKLVSPESIAFGPRGELYIVESDTHHINRVRVVTTDGRIHHLAGTKSKCDCQRSNCRCYDPTESLAAQALFQEITSITITPDGIVHFADSGNLRVFSIISELPEPNWLSQYEVVSTETQELYIFNRYGQHQHTVSIMTDQYLYNFTYNINSFYGRVVAVADSSGKNIQISRDYDRQAKGIISPTGDKCELMMDNMQRLQKFTSPDNTSATFTYSPTTGLLQTKYLSDGKTFTYSYDEMGRLLRVDQPTGEITHLHTDVNATGSIVHVTTDNRNAVAMATYGSVQSALHGSAETKVTYLPDGAVVVVFPSNLTVALETGGHPLLENQHRMHFKRKVIAPNMLVHRLEWRFYLRRKGRAKDGKIIQKLGRRLRVGAHFSRHASMLDSHEGGYKEKALMVNGENLLTIEYDRDTHTETILDKDLHEIITVAYDHSGLPTDFLPARNHHSLNISYNVAGEIIQWQYGDLQERKIYDKGLLRERTSSIGAQYRYQYRGGIKPTDIHLPSGLQYYLEYDNEGNLIMVRTPGLGRHYFHRMITIGSQRFFYQVPELNYYYIEDYDGDGHLQQVVYPSEYRRVTYRYNQVSQPMMILFDQTEINIMYDPQIKMVSSAETFSRGYRCLERFRYQSSLVDHYEITFPDDYKLLSGRVVYEYDNNFRMSSVRAEFSSQNYTSTSNFSYDFNTGKLVNVKYLKFNWPLVDREKIFDDHLIVLREYDLYGRLQDVQYMFHNSIRYKMQVTFDSVNRIHSWSRVIGQTDTTEFQYRYDIDGNMIEVRQDGETMWKYTYDNNGNIDRVTHDGQNVELDFDVGDRIQQFGEWRYKFDLDGFMVQRHEEDLVFDSRGQLTSVTKSGAYKYSYFYDSVGHMVVQRDRLGNIMQYFYTDIARPQLVTHTFNHSNMELTQYFYDASGLLVAFERQDRLSYVASDPMGSPLVIFDENGLIIKQIAYDPLGQIISDSNPNFEFSFGFQGGIYNPVTKLVFHRKRVYDTHIGHWINPDYRGMMKNVRYMVEDPMMMNMYQHRYLVNTHLRERKFPSTDLTDWLKVLGFDLQSMSPNVGYDGMVRPVVEQEDYQLLPTSSAFECTFHRDMDNMLSVKSVPKSKISPKDTSMYADFSPLKSILGDGVVVSAKSSEVRIKVLENAPEWGKKLSSVLLNNSDVLDLKYTILGKDVHYFVKPDASLANEDLKRLGIVGNSASFENGVNLTVNRRSHPDGYRMHSYKEIDVRLHGNYSVINIRYGSTYDHERERILRHAKERAIHRAWEREKWLIQNNLPSYHTWTDEEKQDILSVGYAGGFDIEYIRSAEGFPELADDCNNIRFIKVKR